MTKIINNAFFIIGRHFSSTDDGSSQAQQLDSNAQQGIINMPLFKLLICLWFTV